MSVLFQSRAPTTATFVNSVLIEVKSTDPSEMQCGTSLKPPWAEMTLVGKSLIQCNSP